MDPVAEHLHFARQHRRARALKHRELLTHLTAFGLLLAACGAIAAFDAPSAPPVLLGITCVMLYAAFWHVEFEIGPTAATPAQVLLVPMWFVFDPALLPLAVASAQLLGAVASAAASEHRLSAQRILCGLGDSWFAVGPALVLGAFGIREANLADWPIYALALAAQFAFDAAATMLRAKAVGDPSPRLPEVVSMSTIDLALAPIGLLVALTLVHSPVAILFVGPLALILRQFAKEREERIQHAVELSAAYRGTAHLMGDVLEADDAYTGGEHTQGVVGMALALGEALDLGPRAMRDLEFGALLHDIGKLRVPNEIINKPGKLTDEEWAIIKLHPGWGQEMLDRVGGELSRVGTIVRAHHERWDGAGYPDGLTAEEIPIEARIITVCDSYSAMTTDRAYRKGMSPAAALAELQRCSGTQFDPELVRQMIALYGAETPQLTVVSADAESPAPLKAA
jgi:HD-GYP domain-containing protein (c-di-GMP phosphodiesterase class II)